MSTSSTPQSSPVRGAFGSVNSAFSRPRTASNASSPMRPFVGAVGGAGGGAGLFHAATEEDPLLYRDTTDEAATGKGSARLTAFVNLLTCFIGGGIVALPCAFQKASIIPGMLITTAVCFVTVLSLYYLVFIAVHNRCRNYADISDRFGQWAVTLVHGFLAIILTGVQISVLILMMDQIADLVDAGRSWSNSTPVGGGGGGVRLGWAAAAAGWDVGAGGSTAVSNSISGIAGNVDVDFDVNAAMLQGGYGNHSGGGNGNHTGGGTLPWFESSVFITGVITAGVILPLSLVRKISALRWSSAFAVIALMYTVVLVTTEGVMKLANSSSSSNASNAAGAPGGLLGGAATEGAEAFGPLTTADARILGNSSSGNGTGGGGSIWWNPTLDGVLEATPLIVFSFGCQAQVIPLFNAMPPREQTTRQFMPVIVAAPVLYGLLVMMVGVFGVLAFPGVTPLPGDVMQGFPSTSIPAVTGRAALVIALMFMMPLLMWPNRDSVTAIVKACAPRRPKSQISHVIITVLLTGVEFTLAVVSPGVEKVYGFLGATAGSFLFFIWPSICVLRTRHPSFGLPLRVSAWAVLLFGLSVASLGTYAVVKK